MISVDGRKGLGLGLGFGVGRDMEEPELEEGEACFYQNGDDDDDSTLDPDVALSYLDEKLQHVLGHFQKDFEGGVSAENLGSKFGGYGSFLPTYQRSPARTPPKFQNQNASRSPSNLHLEGGRCNSVSSSASISARHGSAAVRASSVDDFGKQVALSSIHAENKIDNPSDQKTLKVRIKVGSDNLSTRKNAEIYSGLGLDVSPTSSLEDSPTDSQLSREPKNSPDESPTSILEIMTSFPVFGNLLLSPLSDDLICLTEKEKHFRDGVSASVMHKGSQESSLSSLNGSSKGDRKTVGEKRPKPSEKKAFTMELKNDSGNNAQSGVDFKLEKESDLDTSACDELVSNALRLPFLSNSYSSVVDSANNKPLGFVSTQENGWDEKPNGKASLDGKGREFKKVNSDNDEYGYLVKEGNLRGVKNEVPSKADSNMSKGRKNSNVELMDPAKYKVGQKTNSYDDDDMKVATGREHSSPGSRRKPKGSQSHGAQVMTEVPKDNVKTDILSAPKSKKIMNVNTHLSNSDVEDIKKDDGKAKDRYKEFFGDLELEQGDNEIAEEIPSTNRLNNTPLVEKSACGFSNASKERSYGKKIDQPSTSESYARVASNVVPPTGNRPISETAAPVAPLVKEDWVCCDKCQKWRLLPVGTNPQSLPKIWLCSMLNWLDGMNRCSISEEETTKAVISLHQITASGPASGPEGQSNPNRYPGGTLSGVMAVDTLHVDQSHQDIGGKKKQGFKDGSHSTNQDASAPFSNSKKKNPQASVKSRSLNGENQSPSLNEADFQHSSQSSGLFGEKQRLKKKETSKLLENYEGDTKSLKIRNKREADQEFSKASKKLKTDAVHCTDEDRKSENGGTALKVGHSSSCGLSINKTLEDRHKYDDHPKDSKRGSKISGRNPEDQTQFTSDAGSLHTGKYTDRNVKKRKVNEYQDTQLYTTSLGSGGNRLEDQRDFMEETSEDNQSKKRKARVPKSGEKENSIKEGSGGTDKKGRCVKDEQLGVDLGNNLSHRSLDAVDPIKRDMGLVQPSVAATSSSSKVSDSRKNTTNFQEVKGSPVESVSSSPVRVFNQDKFGSTRRFSDGEDGRGSDRSGMVRKDGAITTTNRGSHESPMLDPEDRDLAHISSRKADVAPVPSPEFATHHVTDTVQGDQYSSKPQIADHRRDDESGKGNQYHANGSRRKSGKGSSSRSKDRSRGARSDSDKGKLKESPYDEKSKARSKSLEKMALGSEKVQKNIISKKDPTGNLLTESAKREGKPNSDLQNGSDIRQVILNQDSKQDVPLDRSAERSSKRLPSDRTDRVDASGKGKSHSLPPSGKGQNESTRWPQLISGSHKENGVSMMSSGDDALKAPKQIKPNGHKVRDIDAPSPVRRDSTSQAATNAVKEAKDLKHLADRLKNSGSNNESNVLYFQAALKFLHGASLLESCNGESSKHGEMIQSMQMYSSTAKLCEFCAHEYEKSKDMASAALAYKCVEVAYLRVINSSHANASKDGHELQRALQIVPPGESPSSSASDVDNLNNPVAMDKVTLAKGVSSPQVAGNHIIAARNRSNFVRLLNFAQDVNFAMEASRKSRIAFAAANSRLEDAKYREGMSSVKKALDFNFQDVEGLLRLVRLAMEAISR